MNENFVQSLPDTCLYTNISERSRVVVTAWVDDIIVPASIVELVERFKHSLCCKIKMKDLGRSSRLLGIKSRIESNLKIIVLK